MMTNHFIYLNSGSMVHDLFFKHGDEGRFKVQNFTLRP
jgi:hypothetical protein